MENYKKPCYFCKKLTDESIFYMPNGEKNTFTYCPKCGRRLPSGGFECVIALFPPIPPLVCANSIQEKYVA